jgi:small multidrug resistance family-3 protein
LQQLALLILAAAMEVGGDACVRWGLKSGRVVGLVLGSLVLVLYGFTVNVSKWDFGKLMGVYIAVFFVVSQIMAVALFHERIKAPAIVGGALIVLGGIVLTVWRPQ